MARENETPACNPDIFPRFNTLSQVNRGMPFCQSVDPIVIPSWSGTPPTITASYLINGGDFLWVGAAAESTLPFTCRIQNNAEGGLYLDNQPIRSTLFWGSSSTPGHVVEIPPKWFKDNSQLNFTLGGIGSSGAANTVRLYMWGYRAACGDELIWGKERGLFILGSPDNNGSGFFLPASSVAALTFTSPQGFHFRSVIHQAETNSGSTSWRGALTYRDVRVGNNTPLNKPGYRVGAAAFTGTAINPFLWPSTPVINQDSALNYDLQDYSASNQDVFVCHIGQRIPLNEALNECRTSPYGRSS